MDGRRIAIPYDGDRCTRAGYSTVDADEYEAVASWAFNARSAGVLPPIAEFRIRARLATLDRRDSFGVSAHGPLVSWDHEWAFHAELAHAILADALGDSLADVLLGAPLRQAGLASGRGIDLEPRQRWLLGDRRRLVAILRRAEVEAARDPRMRRADHTLEEAVMAVPDYAEERRWNFTQYTIVP